MMPVLKLGFKEQILNEGDEEFQPGYFNERLDLIFHEDNLIGEIRVLVLNILFSFVLDAFNSGIDKNVILRFHLKFLFEISSAIYKLK